MRRATFPAFLLGAAMAAAALAHPPGSTEMLTDTPPASAQGGPHSSLLPADTRSLGFQQHMGAALPMGVALRDGTGRLVQLSDFFHGEPVILVLDYLRCRNLCGVVLEHTAKALSLTPLTAGRDYQVVAISIDPRDGQADSRAARAKYLAGLSAPSAAAWHFLTGPEAWCAPWPTRWDFITATIPRSISSRIRRAS